jgi:hypothetical protein
LLGVADWQPIQRPVGTNEAVFAVTTDLSLNPISGVFFVSPFSYLDTLSAVRDGRGDGGFWIVGNCEQACPQPGPGVMTKWVVNE